MTCVFTCTYQWSPTEADVFASCSVDQTLRIWDARRKDSSVISIKAHDSDVNVISWNRYLITLSDKIQVSTYLLFMPFPLLLVFFNFNYWCLDHMLPCVNSSSLISDTSLCKYLYIR